MPDDSYNRNLKKRVLYNLAIGLIIVAIVLLLDFFGIITIEY